ncbi:hypothetical protein CLOP_g12816 [Closterium sp. NIES-67]|nr:hypothetical protein CLOP_g12816 [Closterium sp. NIES-67]
MTVPLPSTPPPPRDFLTEYSLGRHLGKGAFGEVLECTHKASGRQFACKRIDKRLIASESDAAEVRKEVAILQQLTAPGSARHGGIVQLVEALEDGAAVYLVMELCEGGDLFDLIKSEHAAGMPEEMAREIFRQVALAVAYCHARGVLHRDIKPENILFTARNPRNEPGAEFAALEAPQGASATNRVESNESPSEGSGDSSANAWRARVRVADFGLALFLPHGQTGHGMAGSRFYTAPEMVRGRRYGKRADVWSMGVVLCAMLTGRVPFAGKDRADAEGLRRSILRGAINFSAPAWAPVSAGARDLVRRMLEVDPRRRLKAAEVLQHPWVLGLDMPDLTAADADAAVAGAASAAVATMEDAEEKQLGAGERPRQQGPQGQQQADYQAQHGQVNDQVVPTTVRQPASPAIAPPLAPPTPPRVASPIRPAASPVRPVAQPPLGSAIERFNKVWQQHDRPQQFQTRYPFAPAAPAPICTAPTTPLPPSSAKPPPLPPQQTPSLPVSTNPFSGCPSFTSPCPSQSIPHSSSSSSSSSSRSSPSRSSPPPLSPSLSQSTGTSASTFNPMDSAAMGASGNGSTGMNGTGGMGASGTSMDGMGGMGADASLSIPLDLCPPPIAVCRKKSRREEYEEASSAAFSPWFSPRPLPPIAAPFSHEKQQQKHQYNQQQQQQEAGHCPVGLSLSGDEANSSMCGASPALSFQAASRCFMALNPWGSPRVHNHDTPDNATTRASSDAFYSGNGAAGFHGFGGAVEIEGFTKGPLQSLTNENQAPVYAPKETRRTCGLAGFCS